LGQRLGTGERQRYASELAGLWSGLSTTLGRLEAIAADSLEQLDDGALEELPGLQYALHRAGELAVGIEPPPGAESAHAELAAALAEARDATGEVIEALETAGPAAAASLVHEWRGALFRVRLARYRLRPQPEPLPAEREEPREGVSRTALAATVLVFAGTVAFTGGAILAAWPLWALGLVLVAAGFLLYRP